MILSQKYKILYIAVPKTATTAIQDWLLSEQVGFKKGRHQINGKEIMLNEHITAKKAKRLLGDDYYNQLRVIAFIRHPFSRFYSSYNFYKGAGKTKSITRQKTIDKKKKFLHAIQFTMAKILPFWIWALIYPYKDNKSYCLDNKNNQIVTYVGIYENLVDDLKFFLNELELDVDFSNLNHLNKSNKKASKEAITNSFFKSLLFLRHNNLKKDLEFYNKVLSHRQSMAL